MTDNPPGYVVEPTAQSTGDRHTDIAKTGLFNACVSVVNSERQTIWQRYNAMLVGNAVVLAFQRGSPAHSFENLIGSGMGFLLCVFWWMLTIDGWRFYDLYCKQAAKFSWPAIDGEANIMQCQYAEYDKIRGDRIKKYALGVIGLFALGYALLFARYFCGP